MRIRSDDCSGDAILIFGRIPAAAEPSLDYVIVLGAKVKPDGSLSKTLKLRLDKALEYMKENPETMLVLSGAKGDAEPCSEADAMETYLLGQGAGSGPSSERGTVFQYGGESCVQQGDDRKTGKSA